MPEAAPPKYQNFAVKDREGRQVEFHENEPLFLIRGQDKLAPSVIDAYADLLVRAGLDEQASEVRTFASRVIEWQIRHADVVKAPD